MSVRPVDIDSFADLLVKSQLVSPDEVRQLVSEFQEDRIVSPVPQEALIQFSDDLVAEGMLTEWQCEKLREGRWKGFYLDQFKLLSCVAVGQGMIRASAENTRTGERFVLSIKPPPGFSYEVLPPEPPG